MGMTTYLDKSFYTDILTGSACVGIINLLLQALVDWLCNKMTVETASYYPEFMASRQVKTACNIANYEYTMYTF